MKGVIVGHTMIGFTVSVLTADSLNLEKRKHITVGLMAMAFAILPDFDLVLGLIEIMESGFQGVSQTREEFWTEGLKFHRGMTHSLILSLFSATVFSLVSYGNKYRIIGLTSASLLIIGITIFLGSLHAVTISFYIVPGIVIASVARRYGLDKRLVIISSFVGLVTHPLGDVFTGPSPELLAPLPFEVISDQLTLFQDSTLHLLSVFMLELITVWIFIHVYLGIKNDFTITYIRPYVLLGVFYGLISPFIRPPTLGSADHFVASILIFSTSVMLIRAFLFKYRGFWLGRELIKILLISGVGVATVSFFSYLASYLLIFH